jgi:seryl-tRNA synthetase
MSNNNKLDVMQISSASNCTDNQSRRFNIRYRPAAPGVAAAQQPPKSKKMKTILPPLQFVHTLNTTCAVPRMIIAILENNQQEDAFVYKLR